MTQENIQPAAKPQPLRVNIQCSIAVGNEEEAQAIYEEVATFAKGVSPTAIIGGQIMRLLGPCCGQKATNERTPELLKKT